MNCIFSDVMLSGLLILNFEYKQTLKTYIYKKHSKFIVEKSRKKLHYDNITKSHVIYKYFGKKKQIFYPFDQLLVVQKFWRFFPIHSDAKEVRKNNC